MRNGESDGGRICWRSYPLSWLGLEWCCSGGLVSEGSITGLLSTRLFSNGEDKTVEYMFRGFFFVPLDAIVRRCEWTRGKPRDLWLARPRTYQWCPWTAWISSSIACTAIIRHLISFKLCTISSGRKKERGTYRHRLAVRYGQHLIYCWNNSLWRIDKSVHNIIYIYIYMSIYVYTRIYIYIYIYTYIYIYIWCQRVDPKQCINAPIVLQSLLCNLCYASFAR